MREEEIVNVDTERVNKYIFTTTFFCFKKDDYLKRPNPAVIIPSQIKV